MSLALLAPRVRPRAFVSSAALVQARYLLQRIPPISVIKINIFNSIEKHRLRLRAPFANPGALALMLINVTKGCKLDINALSFNLDTLM